MSESLIHKKLEEDKSLQHFPETISKKISSRKRIQPVIELNRENMSSNLLKRREAQKFKFSGLIKNSEKRFRIPANFTKTMRKFDLDIDCFEVRVTDQEIFSFCQDLKRCGSLSNIKLRFSGDQGITDFGLKHLGRTLQKLKSLERVNLEFSFAELITIQGLNFLGKILRRISSLKSLSINLPGCSQIASMENENIAFHKYFKNMTSLKHLNLSFFSCLQINDAKLKSIAETFELLTSLKYISLVVTRLAVTL